MKKKKIDVNVLLNHSCERWISTQKKTRNNNNRHIIISGKLRNSTSWTIIKEVYLSKLSVSEWV